MSSIAAARSTVRTLTRPPLRGFLVGFGATMLTGLLVAVVAALAIGLANQGRVLPGVTVDGISLGGLDRAGVEARLSASLPSLTTGSATLLVDGAPRQVSPMRRSAGVMS